MAISKITTNSVGAGTITQPLMGTNVAGNGPAFSAYQSSAQTLSTTTFTKIQFQTEEFDTASAFDNATNYRFTPLVAGYYQVSGGISLNGAATTVLVGLYKNGTLYKYFSYAYSVAASSAYGSALVYLNGTTDYIELYGYVGVGQALVTGISGTYFQAAMIRSA
jgi:hypothetical protein